MHIFKPWKKRCAKLHKTGMKLLYKELRLQGTHCLYTFIESEVRNDKVHKVEKVTKINSRIISKPRAYLQTMAKTCAKFHKDRYKIVWGVALTRYPLSPDFHRIWSQKMKSENDKVHKVEKVTKINSRIISKPYAHLQTMAKTCTKFQKDQYKIVWVAFTRYPLSQHFRRIWGQKMTKFAKWKK